MEQKGLINEYARMPIDLHMKKEISLYSIDLHHRHLNFGFLTICALSAALMIKLLTQIYSKCCPSPCFLSKHM